MCRLMMGHRGSVRKYDKEYGLLELLNYLEKQFGGHGNGVVFMNKGKVVAGLKGVNLTNEEICVLERKTEYDWMIYHTRLVSVGSKTDEQCHPYWEGNDVLAMNGTESSFSSMAHALNTSDSDVIFRCLRGCTPQEAVEALSKMGSVFVGAINGTPIASGSLYGDLERWGKKMFASNFPKGVRTTPMWGDGWIDGKLVKRTAKKRNKWWDDAGSYDYIPSNSYSKGKRIADEYDMGYDAGFEDGYEEGYKVGALDGETTGYESGLEVGALEAQWLEDNDVA